MQRNVTIKVIFSHSSYSLLLLFSNLCLLLVLPLPHPPSHYNTIQIHTSVMIYHRGASLSEQHMH